MNVSKSSAPKSSARVIVVGGGIFGVSTATHLARLGVQVSLVMDGAPASGASGRSLSWLNSARFRSPEYHRLRMIGLDRYRTLAAQRPDLRWLKFDGGLTWDADNDHNAIAEVLAHEKRIGYDARLLTPADVARSIPGVDAGMVTPQGAIFNPGEGWVDLPSLVAMLLEEFSACGGERISDRGPVEIVADRSAPVVAFADGARLAADAVLIAAGAATPRLVEKLGVNIPDATPISILVKTRPVAVGLRVVLNTPRIAVRPNPDGALALDSAWAEEEVVRHADGTFEARESTIAGLVAAASAVLAGNPKLEIASVGVGPKPIPGGGDPVLGALDSVPGCYVAFSHSGATLGLIAGELLAGEIASGEPHPLLSNFTPRRFSA